MPADNPQNNAIEKANLTDVTLVPNDDKVPSNNYNFKCTYCDKSYRHKTSLMNHVHMKHTDVAIPKKKILKLAKASKTDAPRQDDLNAKPAEAMSNVARVAPAPKIAASKSLSTTLKCPNCATKCSDKDVLKKHMKREHTPKTVWNISPNMSTKELDDLLEEEEDLAINADKVEYDIGINASAAEWHSVNFGSSSQIVENSRAELPQPSM